PLRGCLCVAVIIGRRVIPTSATTTIEHLHLAGDNLRRVAVLTILPLPFARAQAALHIHLGALLEVLSGDFRQTVEKDHPMPFGTLLYLARVPVLPGFAGGDTDIGHGATAWHVAGLRVLP